MNVAVCVVTLHLFDSYSLKEKRSLLQSLMAGLRGQEQVSRSVIGISCVNTAAALAQETIDKAVRFIDSKVVGRAEIVDVQTEVLGGFNP